MIRPVILCGGGGTRLWPISTPRRPKQFLPLASSRSMLEETVARVDDPSRFTRPLAIGSARHENLLRGALQNADILLEPVGRDSTAPIAAACLLSSPDDLLLVLPADHHIGNVEAFHSAIEVAARAAEEGQIVTFGIKPDHPATGYGYIESSGVGPVRAVTRFVEKPDAATAASYLQTERFFWNAGIFLFKASVMTAALERHAPDIPRAVREALVGGVLDRAAFAKVRSQSIDYAVLEKAQGIAVVPVSMEWSDLGDYRALHAASQDDFRNAVVSKGPVATTETRKAYVRSDGLKVAVHGLKDVAVVATNDSVLVAKLSDAAGIKAAASAVHDLGTGIVRQDQREWLRDWLWGRVMPKWAKLAIDQSQGCFVENIAIDHEGPAGSETLRGRIVPRQLFAFARARRMGWNPSGAADCVIDAAYDFLANQGRSPRGGWAHKFNPDGSIQDDSRDLYDHAFIALAGSELAAEGDHRGLALADEAFSFIDSFFVDPNSGGWHDPETAPGVKLANPHMHLLEASLAHYEAIHDPASLKRIEIITALFERWMFDPETSAVIENFAPDWSRARDARIEPGHCYEWAFLLGEVERLTGRDTASWRRRLVGFAEGEGLVDGLAVDVFGSAKPTFRLWPQLERLRALSHMQRSGADIPAVVDKIMTHYLERGPAHGWVDKIGADHKPITRTVPASMLYHHMTALAPIAPPRKV